jgi:DNA polymerase III epsilon subunit family exonuclease
MGHHLTQGVWYGENMKSEILRPNERYIAVDVETTGLSPRHGARIIEIAAVALNDNGLAEEFQSLINPGVNVPKVVQRVHGITNAALRGQPPPEYVFSQFSSFIASNTLIAHNAPFDMGFLRAEFKRQNMEMRNHNQCTLQLSRKRLPGLPDYKLATVYRHLFGELPADPQHRALADARMAGRIWLELKKR